jgi:hypothetical protein
VDWKFEDQSYEDELALAKAILAAGQPAIVQLGPVIVRVTWKESDQPEGEDWNYIVRSRTIRLEPSATDAVGQDGERAAALVDHLGVITREHGIAYANLKPSRGEIVNQPQCERYLGEMLESVHDGVHRFRQGS